jgi:hypothetical protein
MRLDRVAIVALCGALSLAFGCGDKPIGGDAGDDGSGDGGDAGGGDGDDDTCVEDRQCDAWEICEGQECVDGDRNNAVEEAQTLLWSDTATGYINPASDVDYFAIEAEGGEYVRLAVTLAEGFEDSDTVLELRRSNGKIVSSADAFATETGVTGVDAVVFAYLDEPGTYYVTVEDDGSAGRDAEGAIVGGPGYRYTVELSEWGDATSESDALDDPSITVSLDSERIWNTVGVLLEEEGDTDFIALDYVTDGLTLYLDGNQDLDGSDATPRVRLLTEGGEPLTDKVGVGPEEYALAPALEAGSYVIEVSDAGGGGSANHWTFVHIIARPDEYEHDLESESNDSLVSANAVSQAEFENSGGNKFTRGQVQGAADDAADEDWFRFEAGYSESWVVACLNSTLWGSEMAPDIEIYDAGGSLLETGSATSTGEPNALIENLQVEPGDYYLRVVPPSDIVGGPGAWYRFNLFVASFEVGGYACPD